MTRGGKKCKKKITHFTTREREREWKIQFNEYLIEFYFHLTMKITAYVIFSTCKPYTHNKFSFA